MPDTMKASLLHGLHRVGAMRREPTVIIWQADGGRGHDLAFMYKPVMDTLVSGFSDMPSRFRSDGIKPRVIHGHGVGAMRSMMRSMFNGDSNSIRPDVFIWIGPVGSEAPSWQMLNRRGVKTVYYQTEPSDGCNFGSTDHVQELWEFSWHNFDMCKPRLPKRMTMRYVPLGYNEPSAASIAAATAAESPTTPAELIFFGYPFYKSGRARCYGQLQRTLGERLNATWSIWREADFETWWRDSGRWAAHLNLHKHCENNHNPVVFRTSFLLSRGAIVVSEHSYARDEREYDGLVHFARVKELPEVLDRVLVARRNGDTRASAIQLRSQTRKLYAERFAPQRIFERARVYDDLFRTSLHNSSSSLPSDSDAVVIGSHELPTKAKAASPRMEWHSSAAPTTSQYALILHGRIGTIQVTPSNSLVSGHLTIMDYAQPIAACAASHIEHVVRANAAVGGVDVYAHTWNPSISAIFNRAYSPYLRASLHEPLEFSDKLKPRSQALSIGRAVQLMKTHEARSGRSPYRMVLVLRADLMVGAPIVMNEFDPRYIWFAEHCCLNEAKDNATKALVQKRCAATAKRGDPRYVAKLTGEFNYRKRVLGPCRASQYGGQWGLQHKKADHYYFLMDWWFAASPSVALTWLDVSEDWKFYQQKLNRLPLARWFSHYVWAIHVHDRIQRTASIRFKAGVRVNLARNSWNRLGWAAGRKANLGEYVTDAIGNCATLRTVNNVTISFNELLKKPVPRQSALGKLFEDEFAPMAEQCALARLEEPVICCGEPRTCGEYFCDGDYVNSNWAFLAAARTVKADLPGKLANTKLSDELPPTAQNGRKVTKTSPRFETKKPSKKIGRRDHVRST